MCGGLDVSNTESDADSSKRAAIGVLQFKAGNGRVRNRRCPYTVVETGGPLQSSVESVPCVRQNREIRKGFPPDYLTARDSLPSCSTTGNME